jgi:hypothetical protein
MRILSLQAEGRHGGVWWSSCPGDTLLKKPECVLLRVSRHPGNSRSDQCPFSSPGGGTNGDRRTHKQLVGNETSVPFTRRMTLNAHRRVPCNVSSVVGISTGSFLFGVPSCRQGTQEDCRNERNPHIVLRSPRANARQFQETGSLGSRLTPRIELRLKFLCNVVKARTGSRSDRQMLCLFCLPV